MNRTEKSFW